MTFVKTKTQTVYQQFNFNFNNILNEIGIFEKKFRL